MELWQINEVITDRGIRDLTRGFDRVEEQIFAILQRYLMRFDLSNGEFVAQTATASLINQMNREIAQALTASSLDSEIEKFLTNFDEIGDNIKQIHRNLSDVNVPNRIINQQKQFALDRTLYSLREANVSTDFIAPVKRVLYQRITTGASLLETERELRALIMGDDKTKGALTRWVGQVARDGVNQYKGAIHQAVKNEFGFTALAYVNSLVEDSRSQCRRWTEMGRIEEEQLQQEINWAFQNGQGMIPETNPDNFIINRGGYNCRHEAIPVR